MAAEREHAESSSTESPTVAKVAESGCGATHTGLRSAGAEAQLRAAVGLQRGVCTGPVPHAAAARASRRRSPSTRAPPTRP